MTGRAALDNFKSNPLDLLIADLHLPDIDGMEVIKQVRQRRPDTGVIVITGYASIPSAVEAMKLGASDYLPKPFTEQEVLSAVGAALGIQWPLISDAAVVAEPAEAIVEPVPDDQQRITQIMAEIRQTFSGHREELISVLQFFQGRMGFIPEAALSEIACFTHTPAVSVYGVATFYEQFRLKPVGRHIVKVCRGTACHVKGAERIINEIESRFSMGPGDTSKDCMFTLETVACFGSCAIVPVVLVDDKVKGRMNPARTRKAMGDVCPPGRPIESAKTGEGEMRK